MWAWERPRPWPTHAGRLLPHVEHSLPLEQAAEAYGLIESGRVRGKIVLTVSPSLS